MYLFFFSAPSGRNILFEGLLLTEFELVDGKYLITDQIWYWSPQGLLSALPDLDPDPIREKVDEFAEEVINDEFLTKTSALLNASPPA